MKIIDRGYTYQLTCGELCFEKTEDEGTKFEGATEEEVITAVIDRLKFFDEKNYNEDRKIAIKRLDEALAWLELCRKEKDEENE